MKDLFKKTDKELIALLAEKRLALRTFRFSIAGSNVRNVKEGNALKKEIARILTVINSKNDINGNNVEVSLNKKLKAPKAN